MRPEGERTIVTTVIGIVDWLLRRSLLLLSAVGRVWWIPRIHDCVNVATKRLRSPPGELSIPRLADENNCVGTVRCGLSRVAAMGGYYYDWW
jgi:hypothetical protein